MSAKKDLTKEAEAVLDAIGRGEPVPSGWTFDPQHDPIVYKGEPEPVEETGDAKD